PRVSVLIPAYNRAHWVGGAIASVLAQDVDCEILLVDNGSTDGTWDLLQHLQDAHPQVKATRWPHNNGMEVYPALLEMARGEYVNFFADDDEMLPGGLARKLAVLDAHPAIGVVFSTVRYMDDAGVDQGEAPWGRLAETDLLEGGEYFDRLIQGNFVPMPAAMYRRALAPTGDLLRIPTFGHAKDWHFWLDLARRTAFAYLREPTVRLRLHPGQATVMHGVAGGGFVESTLTILHHWMLEADPPYIPSAAAWETHKLTMARALWAAFPGDSERCVEGLHRLQALRTALDDRLNRDEGRAALPEAFLFEPDWTGAEWVEVLLSYVDAFGPGEPVVLLLVQNPDAAIAPGDAQEAVLQVVAGSGRETFADVMIVDEPAALLGQLRAYPHIQWVTAAMEGAGGRRFAEARRRLAQGVRP
ncbi:MAG: glycosyltransferase, partial [Holophaga sp.]|nr:glycosyltransferase [Holophaga sp.]